MDEEGADTGRLKSGIEVGIILLRDIIASEQRAPLAPATGRDEAAFELDDEVGAVTNQLAVDTEDSSEGSFDLLLVIVRGLECADGFYDEGLELCGVLEGCFAKGDLP
jgi:hypothetical protein